MPTNDEMNLLLTYFQIILIWMVPDLGGSNFCSLSIQELDFERFLNDLVFIVLHIVINLEKDIGLDIFNSIAHLKYHRELLN